MLLTAIGQRGHMLARNDQEMHRRGRVDVVKAIRSSSS
jgi:hypothetical protein